MNKEPLTVQDLLDNLKDLLQKKEITLDTPLIYSSDDE
jgi:hypothetical protein